MPKKTTKTKKTRKNNGLYGSNEIPRRCPACNSTRSKITTTKTDSYTGVINRYRQCLGQHRNGSQCRQRYMTRDNANSIAQTKSPNVATKYE